MMAARYIPMKPLWSEQLTADPGQWDCHPTHLGRWSDAFLRYWRYLKHLARPSLHAEVVSPSTIPVNLMLRISPRSLGTNPDLRRPDSQWFACQMSPRPTSLAIATHSTCPWTVA
ncbi:hypothetical protein BDR03DRAFT_376291 [Suillus americanus]|nr:hypothetical protein BDR03DRAFT_376291 [Suillus americanus]